MRHRCWLRRLTPVALALLVAPGCGEPTLAPVKGRVTYQGSPLTRGRVVFVPDSDKGGRGPLAWAEIGPDGAYELRSGDAPGAAVGWHRVTVLAVEPVTGDEKVRLLVPPRYAVPELSGLTGRVREDGPNVIDFDLP